MAIETSELNKLQYSSFPKIFERFRKMAAENQGIPMSSITSAFAGINSGRYGLANPYIQNRRVKQISSLPADFTKDQVAEMLTKPYDSDSHFGKWRIFWSIRRIRFSTFAKSTKKC